MFLVLYGTFWSNYIFTESNFRYLVLNRQFWMARSLYILGLIPTLIVIAASCSIAYAACSRRKVDGDMQAIREAELSLLVVLFMLGAVVIAGCRYYYSSSFQGRLLFPAMLAMSALLGHGLSILGKSPWLHFAATLPMCGLYAFMNIYFAIEVYAAAAG